MGQLLDAAIYLSGFGTKCDCHQSVCQQYPDEHKVFRLLECAERLQAIDAHLVSWHHCPVLCGICIDSDRDKEVIPQQERHYTIYSGGMSVRFACVISSAMLQCNSEILFLAFPYI